MLPPRHPGLAARAVPEGKLIGVELLGVGLAPVLLCGPIWTLHCWEVGGKPRRGGPVSTDIPLTTGPSHVFAGGTALRYRISTHRDLHAPTRARADARNTPSATTRSQRDFGKRSFQVNGSRAWLARAILPPAGAAGSSAANPGSPTRDRLRPKPGESTERVMRRCRWRGRFRPMRRLCGAYAANPCFCRF